MTMEQVAQLRQLCGQWEALPAEDAQEIVEALQTGSFLSVWAQDQLIGFLSYKRIQDGAVWISQCYALSSDAFWNLVKQGRQITATRIHFHRHKTRHWSTRRWHHALVSA
jgi:hypothetical protein